VNTSSPINIGRIFARVKKHFHDQLFQKVIID